MTERFYIGYFENEHDVVAAATAARRNGYEILDVFAPYPVHGLAQAVGLPSSRLVWIGLWAGIIGLVLGLTLQVWTSAYDWPLIIGGQPFNAWPVFIPVSFELTVLFAGVIGTLALLARTRLFPGHLGSVLGRVSDDRFAVVLVQSDSSVDPDEMIAMLRERGAIEVVEGDEVA
ncbi:MAG: DUF3341 domain-containing protein [Armatimonadota bacterium]